MQKTNYFKEKGWCPETDLNRRHADFQSAALPTELSGRRSIFASGWRVVRTGRHRCPERKTNFSLLLVALLDRGAGDAVVAPEPARQIDIRTAARAERPVMLDGGFAADRAGHAAVPTLARRVSGRRSRLRLISNSPIVNGGETNYVMATVGLFVTIYNLFSSLLMLFGLGGSNDD